MKKKKKPKYYPNIKQGYILRKFCTVTRPVPLILFDPVK